MTKPIQNLDEISESALLRIHDRIKHIKGLLELDVTVNEAALEFDKLSPFVDPWMLDLALIELIAILYRSLFQKAEWDEGGAWKEIALSALLPEIPDPKWEDKHMMLIEFANKVIAHQDATTELRKIEARKTPDGTNKVRYKIPSPEILHPILTQIDANLVAHYEGRFGIKPKTARRIDYLS